jgi:nitroimidazol reductase NimA-like FMN-containing flavoprotein (pyridoxamine 5'-phosphate oxidase superfamily)
MTRRGERARYDREIVYAIFDEALVSSVALVVNRRPELRPMIHARVGEELILHGLGTNPFLAALASGAEACINVMLIDGLVLARRIEDHSMFYRSATLYGRGSDVGDEKLKASHMRAVFTKLAGSTRFDRLPKLSEAYLAQTRVVSIPLQHCVAKVNDQSPRPRADETDIWSGVIPIRLSRGEPVADELTARSGLLLGDAD